MLHPLRELKRPSKNLIIKNCQCGWITNFWTRTTDETYPKCGVCTRVLRQKHADENISIDNDHMFESDDDTIQTPSGFGFPGRSTDHDGFIENNRRL